MRPFESMQRRPVPLLVMLVVALIFLPAVTQVWGNTDTTGGTGSASARGSGIVYGFPITISASGMLQSIGIEWPSIPSAGNLMAALYNAGSGKPSTLVVQSSSTPTASSAGWQDVPTPSSPISAGSYWVAVQISVNEVIYTVAGSRSWYGKSFSSFDPTWSASSAQDSADQWSMRVTYSTGPPSNDFTITANPTSQSVGAGSTADYSLSILYGTGLTATVNLAVTAGCPSGFTCTITPNSVTASGTATLAVSTLITTPTGTTSITVTASSTSPSLSHTVTVQLTVSGPGTYSANIHSGATQVVVTVSWTGGGTASVVLAGQGGTPTLSESGQVVYDRLTYISGSNMPTSIHRVSFNISSYSPATSQTWTVYVSLSASYTVTIEVS